MTVCGIYLKIYESGMIIYKVFSSYSQNEYMTSNSLANGMRKL